jgi:hypothetical protein
VSEQETHRPGCRCSTHDVDIACVDWARTQLEEAGQEVSRLREALEFQAATTKALLPYQDRAVAAESRLAQVTEALRHECFVGCGKLHDAMALSTPPAASDGPVPCIHGPMPGCAFGCDSQARTQEPHDYEITRFRMLGAKDAFKRARVWGCESDRDHPEAPWTVYHRPDPEASFPVKIEPARDYNDALRIARALVEAYTPAPPTAKEEPLHKCGRWCPIPCPKKWAKYEREQPR